MIKLKSLLLISEEKLAFSLLKQGKLRFTTVDDTDPIIITMYSTDNEELGYIQLLRDASEELGDVQPKPGYLFMDFVEVYQQGEGFGFLLYYEALKYCLKNRFRGLVSGKDHRIDKTQKIWNTITTSSDKYYDYADANIALKKISI